jgi:dipeptidyl aminopeptidase/acylaminoacyl peptidase
MAEKLRAAGVSAKAVVVEGEGHGRDGEKWAKSMEQSVAFFDEHLKK